jgi:hypothetical protein
MYMMKFRGDYYRFTEDIDFLNKLTLPGYWKKRVQKTALFDDSLFLLLGYCTTRNFTIYTTEKMLLGYFIKENELC